MVVEHDVLDAEALAGFLRLGPPPRAERGAALGLVPRVPVGERHEPHAVARLRPLDRRATGADVAVVGVRSEDDDVERPILRERNAGAKENDVKTMAAADQDILRRIQTVYREAILTIANWARNEKIPLEYLDENLTNERSEDPYLRADGEKVEVVRGGQPFAIELSELTPRSLANLLRKRKPDLSKDDARSVWATQDAIVNHYGVAYSYQVTPRTSLYAAVGFMANKDQGRLTPRSAGYTTGFATEFGADTAAYQLGFRHAF